LQINCDNITSKNFQLLQKKSNPLVQIIYRIELGLRINYRKTSSMRCDCHPWFKWNPEY